MNEIGKKIEELRNSKGWSQDNMAIELGISQPSYARLIKQSESITIGRLMQMAKLFQTSVSDIIGEPSKKVNYQNNNENANAYFDTVYHADKDHIETLKSEIVFLRKLLEERKS
jgi:transcriptional regulator with XRE-family HTH domain